MTKRRGLAFLEAEVPSSGQRAKTLRISPLLSPANNTDSATSFDELKLHTHSLIASLTQRKESALEFLKGVKRRALSRSASDAENKKANTIITATNALKEVYIRADMASDAEAMADISKAARHLRAQIDHLGLLSEGQYGTPPLGDSMAEYRKKSCDALMERLHEMVGQTAERLGCRFPKQL